MNLIWLFAVSIVPGIFWVWYFYRQDHLDPEPWGLVARSFIAGALTVIPVSIIETPFASELKRPDNILGLLFTTIFVVGFTEEIFKFLAAYFSVYKNKEFNEVMDGIIYVVTAGLGFAAVENLIYTTIFGYKVGAIRAVVTSLAHAGFSGIVGFNFGMARCNPEKRKFYIIYGLVWGSVLHGLYDFLVLTRTINFITTIAIVFVLQIYVARLIKKAEILSPFK
jgi:RsiW-degrading membrane proteinase PrsW (M82 family)